MSNSDPKFSASIEEHIELLEQRLTDINGRLKKAVKKSPVWRAKEQLRIVDSQSRPW